MTDIAALVERLRAMSKYLLAADQLNVKEAADALEALQANLYHATVAVNGIREHALEEAAQVAEGYGSNYPMIHALPARAFYAKDIAATIRALRESKP